MTASDITKLAKDAGGGNFPVAARDFNGDGSAIGLKHAVANAAGTTINPATDESVQAVTTALGSAGTGAPALGASASGVIGWLRKIVDTLAAGISVTGTFFQATQPVSGSVSLTGSLPGFAAPPTVNLGALNGAALDTTVAAGTTAIGLVAKDATVAKDSSLATLHADLGSIISTLQAQRAETLWTDDTGAFFVRIDKGGAITWTDPNGNVIAGPGTGARPAAGTSAIVDSSRYQATAASTGYSIGDYLSHVVTTDPATGVVIGHFWLNVTTEVKLASSPSSANITPIASLPAGASTSALQTTGNTTLAQLHTDLGTVAQDGTDITGSSMPAGGVGIRGWLSASYGKLAAMLTALGSPAQDGTDITGFVMPAGGVGIRGWLSAIKANLDTLVANETGTDAIPVRAPQVEATSPLANTIAVGGTAQDLFAANPSRQGWAIKNLSNAPLYLRGKGSAGTTVADTTPESYRLDPGEYYCPDYVSPNGISVLGPTTGQTFWARSW